MRLYSNPAIFLSFLGTTLAQTEVHIITITAYPATCSIPTALPSYAWIYTNGSTIPYAFTNNSTIPGGSTFQSGSSLTRTGGTSNPSISDANNSLGNGQSYASGTSRTSQRTPFSLTGSDTAVSSVGSSEGNAGGSSPGLTSSIGADASDGDSGATSIQNGYSSGTSPNTSAGSGPLQTSLPSAASNSLIPSRTTPGSRSGSNAGGSSISSTGQEGSGAPTPAPPYITMSPSLDCPTSQAAYGYEEPTSGDQYQVQCNTVFAGSLLDVLSARDMESCLSSCSANDDCLGAGFDEDSSSCTLYSAVISGTSTLSPKTQFAQLRVRAVVTGGTTSSITIATFDIPLTSFPITSPPSTTVTGQRGPITQLILPGTTLSPGSTAVISGTSYSFPTSANSIFINGQPYPLPTASPAYIGSPVTLPNGVVATPTTIGGQISTADPNAGQATQLVLAGTTLSPGSSAIISGTTYSLATPPSSLYINDQPYALPTASPGYIGSPLTLPNGVIATPTTAGLLASTPNPNAGQITSLVIAGTTLSPGSTAVISGASYSLPSSGGQVYIDGTSYALPTVGPSFTLPNGVVATPTTAAPEASNVNSNAGQITQLVVAGSILSQGSAVVISGTTYSLPIAGGAVYVDGASYALPTVPGSPLTLPNGVVASPTAVPGGSPSLPPQTAGITSLVLPGTTLLPGSTATISGTYYSFPASGGAVFIDGTPFTWPMTAGLPFTLPNGVVATPTVGNASPSTTPRATSLILPGTTLAPGSSAVISGTTYSLPTSGGVYINGQSYAFPTASVGSPITLPNGIVATPTVEAPNPAATAVSGIAFPTTSVANIILRGTTLAPGSTAVIAGTTFSLPVSGDAIFVNGQSFPMPTGSAGSPVTLADGLVVTPTAIPNVVIGSHTFTPSSATEVVLAGTTLVPGSSVVISGTTYSLPTSGNSIFVNGALFTLSNILPGAPLTLPNGVQATPTNAPNWLIGTQTLAPGGPAVTVAGTTYSLSGSQIVVAAPSTTFTGGLNIPTGGPATTAGSSGASPGGTLPAPTGPQTTGAPGSPNSGLSVSGTATATSSRRLTSSTRSNARSSTTFLSGGSVVSTTLQGITTSYTANATTIVAAVTADPKSALPSTTDTIADAEIGQCPGINGMISQDADDVDSRLVSCGNIYEGTVLVNATQVGNNVDGCNDLCDGIQDCVALSATRDGCNIYTYVTGIHASDKPVFSALRLRAVRNSGSTTTIDVADVESLTESLSLTNATILSTTTFDSLVDSSSDLAGSWIGSSSVFLGSTSVAAQSASSSGLTSTPPTTGADLSMISSRTTISTSSEDASQSADASLGSETVGASPIELDTTVSISGSSLMLPSITGSQGTFGSNTASLEGSLPSVQSTSAGSVLGSARTTGGIVSTGSTTGQPSSTTSLSGTAPGSPSTAISTFNGVQSTTSARSGSESAPAVSASNGQTALQTSTSSLIPGSVSGISLLGPSSAPLSGSSRSVLASAGTPITPGGSSPTSAGVPPLTSPFGLSSSSPQNAGQSLLSTSVQTGSSQLSPITSSNTKSPGGSQSAVNLSASGSQPTLSARASSTLTQSSSVQAPQQASSAIVVGAGSSVSPSLQPNTPSSSTASQGIWSSLGQSPLQSLSSRMSMSSTGSSVPPGSLSATASSSIFQPSTSSSGSGGLPASQSFSASTVQQGSSGRTTSSATQSSASSSGAQTSMAQSNASSSGSRPILSVTGLPSGTTLDSLTVTILPDASSVSTQLSNSQSGSSVVGASPVPGSSTASGATMSSILRTATDGPGPASSSGQGLSSSLASSPSQIPPSTLGQTGQVTPSTSGLATSRTSSASNAINASSQGQSIFSIPASGSPSTSLSATGSVAQALSSGPSTPASTRSNSAPSTTSASPLPQSSTGASQQGTTNVQASANSVSSSSGMLNAGNEFTSTQPSSGPAASIGLNTAGSDHTFPHSTSQSFTPPPSTTMGSLTQLTTNTTPTTTLTTIPSNPAPSGPSAGGPGGEEQEFQIQGFFPPSNGQSGARTSTTTTPASSIFTSSTPPNPQSPPSSLSPLAPSLSNTTNALTSPPTSLSNPATLQATSADAPTSSNTLSLPPNTTYPQTSLPLSSNEISTFATYSPPNNASATPFSPSTSSRSTATDQESYSSLSASAPTISSPAWTSTPTSETPTLALTPSDSSKSPVANQTAASTDFSATSAPSSSMTLPASVTSTQLSGSLGVGSSTTSSVASISSGPSSRSDSTRITAVSASSNTQSSTVIPGSISSGSASSGSVSSGPATSGSASSGSTSPGSVSSGSTSSGTASSGTASSTTLSAASASSALSSSGDASFISASSTSASPISTTLAPSSSSRVRVSVQSAAPTSSTQASPTPSAQPTAACSGGSSTYTSGSGSEFLISCDYDYYVESLNTAQASSLTDCTNLCSNDLQCMGATWDDSSEQCNLGSQMTPTNARLGVRAVLRMTAPRSLQSLTESASNGGFDGNSLSPWYNSQFGTDPIDPSTSTGPELSVVNGAAQASLPLSQGTDDSFGFPPSFQVRVVQTFRIPQGYFYFMLADVAVTSQGDTSCGVSFSAENAGLPSLFLNPGESYVGTVNGSGNMAYAESAYVSVSASCQGHADATVRIDNVRLDIWPSNDGGATASSVTYATATQSTEFSSSAGIASYLISTSSSPGQNPTATASTISSGSPPTPISSDISGFSTGSQVPFSTGPMNTQAASSSLGTASSTGQAASTSASSGQESSTTAATSSGPSVLLSPSSSVLGSATSFSPVETSSASLSVSYTALSAATISSSTEASILQSSGPTDASTTSSPSIVVPVSSTSSTGGQSTSSTASIASTTSSQSLSTSGQSFSSSLAPTTSQSVSSSSQPSTSITQSTLSAFTTSATTTQASNSATPTTSSSSDLSSSSGSTVLATPVSSSSTLLMPSSTSIAVVSTSTQSTGTVGSSTSSAAARPTLACPQADGSIYTGQDGSTYLIVCIQAYETIGIGILPQTALTLTACIDLCVNQGTACQGVSWKPGANECSLKGSMTPTTNTLVQVYSAVRISGPLINGLRNDVNVILNGVFDASLNPWVSTVTGLVGALTGLVNSLLFTLVNGIASVGIPLSLGLGQPVLYLTETLSVAANQAWYLQADVYLINAQVSTTTSCTIYFRTDQEILWSYYYDRCSQQGRINGSGIVTKAAASFYTQTACTGSTDVSIGFDNIIWRLYPLAAGLNPIVLTAVQVLTNNDFGAGVLAPWVVQSVVSATTDVTVNSAKALQVAFNRIAATASPCSIAQTLNRIRAGQTYWLRASVAVTIASTAGLAGLGAKSATCDLILGANFWSTTTTAASSLWNVNVTGIATSDYTNFTMFVNCYGNAVATVTFDNIFLTRDVTLY